jgi:hypothetical protein
MAESLPASIDESGTGEMSATVTSTVLASPSGSMHAHASSALSSLPASVTIAGSSGVLAPHAATTSTPGASNKGVDRRDILGSPIRVALCGARQGPSARGPARLKPSEAPFPVPAAPVTPMSGCSTLDKGQAHHEHDERQ